MYLIMIYFIIVSFLSVLMFFVAFFFNKKIVFDYQKSSPFECGFNTMTMKRLPFSIHFFLVAVIFLIFDVEIVLIFPVVIILKYSSLYSWFFVISFFLILLVLGLYHEWYNGILNWTF